MQTTSHGHYRHGPYFEGFFDLRKLFGENSITGIEFKKFDEFL